jgi:DNA polymerase I-like protein with 3'-5' exonuclease and polymerase domains
MRNEILSFDGQCNGSDILKINALIPFRKSLPDFGARLVLTVHDSVLISGPEKNAEALHKHIKETMEAPIAAMNGFFIPVSIKVGESWGGVKRWEKWLAARQVVTN